MTSKQIRQLWIKFFESKGHLFLESKSLVPYKDDSLLWINSGVATLKDYFSGKKKPPAKRLVNSQKSLRTNDIENVGKTSRHHTFFEMLGNFSIGDYFKNEAIEFADEFLLKILKLEKDKLFITYFNKDLTTRDKWLALGYDQSHLIAGNKDLNFWDVGNGPCGPCTEIFYDRGKKYDQRGKILIEEDIENDRFIEIWNIVFSEYNNLGNNQYEELEQKNIDTGAGLERIASILQDAPTNFDTDLFLPIIHEIEKFSSFLYDQENYFIKDKKQEEINMYFKIIADHLRASVNAIADGVSPSNTLRGYIIRRLIRRSYYYGLKLGISEKAFLYKLVKVIKNILIYDFDTNEVEKIIKKEELSFSETIVHGKKILEDAIRTSDKIFDPKIVFKLYETYGFPIDMTKDILLENNLEVDDKELDKLKIAHSDISKSKEKKAVFAKTINSLALINEKLDNFIGYDYLDSKSKVLKILNDSNEIEQLNGKGYLILDKTPFYATSGGQHCDSGFILQNAKKFKVLNVFKDKNNNHIHFLDGIINKNNEIQCKVDKFLRKNSMRNHSATHLTFAALRKRFGKNQIVQLGSDNNPERLTFDFPLETRPTQDDIKFIENFVNDAIQKAIERKYIITTTKQAQKMGAIMTLEEAEYMDQNNIRIVHFENISSDLCGGTHVENTKDIEIYKIVSLETKGSGIWRIRALTSFQTVNKYLEQEISKYIDILNASITKAKNFKIKIPDFNLLINDLEQKLLAIKNQIQIIRNLIKEKQKDSKKSFDLSSIDFEEFFISEQKVIFINIEDKANIKILASQLRETYLDALIIISSNSNQKTNLVIATKAVSISKIIEKLAQKTSIQGGGSPILWQGVITAKVSKQFLTNALK